MYSTRGFPEQFLHGETARSRLPWRRSPHGDEHVDHRYLDLGSSSRGRSTIAAAPRRIEVTTTSGVSLELIKARATRPANRARSSPPGWNRSVSLECHRLAVAQQSSSFGNHGIAGIGPERISTASAALLPALTRCMRAWNSRPRKTISNCPRRTRAVAGLGGIRTPRPVLGDAQTAGHDGLALRQIQFNRGSCGSRGRRWVPSRARRRDGLAQESTLTCISAPGFTLAAMASGMSASIWRAEDFRSR